MNAALLHEPLTRSVEDYLKTIYRLSQKGQPATTNDIAHQLDLSAPSVSGMIKRLSEQGLLEHIPYKGVVLTLRPSRRSSHHPPSPNHRGIPGRLPRLRLGNRP